MSDIRYMVVANGRTLGGCNAEQAIQAFSARFRVSAERARSVVGKRTILRRGVTQEVAAKFVKALHSCGLEGHFEIEARADAAGPVSRSDPSPERPRSKAEPVASPTVGTSSSDSSGTVAAVQGMVATNTGHPVVVPAGQHDREMDRRSARVATVDSTSSFLASLNLSHLDPILNEHAITPEMLPSLTDDDLKSIGVERLGDRKRLLAGSREVAENVSADQAVAINEEMDISGQDAVKTILILEAVFAGLVFLAGLGMEASLAEAVGMGCAAFALTWLFFLPTQIAFRRQVDLRWAILVGNIFFGATMLGWVILLVLALRLVTPVTGAVIGVAGAMTSQL